MRYLALAEALELHHRLIENSPGGWASGALGGTWGDYVSACGVAFVSKSAHTSVGKVATAPKTAGLKSLFVHYSS